MFHFPKKQSFIFFSCFVLCCSQAFASDDEGDTRSEVSSSFPSRASETPYVYRPRGNYTPSFTQDEKETFKEFFDRSQLLHWDYPKCEHQIPTLKVQPATKTDLIARLQANREVLCKIKQFHVYDPDEHIWDFFIALSGLFPQNGSVSYGLHIFGKVPTEWRLCFHKMYLCFDEVRFKVVTLDYALQFRPEDLEAKNWLMACIPSYRSEKRNTLECLTIRWAGLTDDIVHASSRGFMENFPNVTHLGFPFNNLTDASFATENYGVSAYINTARCLQQIDLRGNAFEQPKLDFVEDLPKDRFIPRKMRLNYNNIAKPWIERQNKFATAGFEYLCDHYWAELSEDRTIFDIMKISWLFARGPKVSASQLFGRQVSSSKQDLCDLGLLLYHGAGRGGFQEIDLSDLSDLQSNPDCLVYLLESLPQSLIHLDLHNNHLGHIDDYSIYRRVLDRFRNLKVLDLSNTDFIEVLQICDFSCLEDLSLKGIKNPDLLPVIGWLFRNVHTRFPKLKRLDLSQGIEPTDEEVSAYRQQIARHPFLRHIEHCPNVFRITGEAA